MSKDVSKTYEIKATEVHPGEFEASWAAPGLAFLTLERNHNPLRFYTRERALLEAAIAMVAGLNAPRLATAGHKKQERFKKLEAAEFAVALHHAGITPSFLAYLIGTDPARVLKWLDGSESVPHPVRVLLALFTKYGDDAIDVAEASTDAVTTERKPNRKD